MDLAGGRARVASSSPSMSSSKGSGWDAFEPKHETQRPSGARWAAPAVILVGGLLGGIVGVGLDRSGSTSPQEVESLETAQLLDARFGRIAIASEPRGAIVEVNGELVRAEDGSPARTPIAALTELQYGKTYSIRLRLEGYGDYQHVLTMGPATDRYEIWARLQPD